MLIVACGLLKGGDLWRGFGGVEFFGEGGGFDFVELDGFAGEFEVEEFAEVGEDAAEAADGEGEGAIVGEDDEELLAGGGVFGEAEEVVFDEGGEDGLEVEVFAVDFEAGGEGEPAGGFFDEFCAPGGGVEAEGGGKGAGGDGDLPAAFFEGGDGFVLEALPVGGGLPFFLVGGPEGGVEGGEFFEGVGWLLGAGKEVEGVEGLEGGHLGSPVAGWGEVASGVEGVFLMVVNGVGGGVNFWEPGEGGIVGAGLDVEVEGGGVVWGVRSG